MTHIEAECTRCKETFIIPDVILVELIHGETSSGQDCGGIGVVQGQWVFNTELGVNRTYEITRAIIHQETHGKAEPFCDDPHCVWHYPEGIVLERTGGE